HIVRRDRVPYPRIARPVRRKVVRFSLPYGDVVNRVSPEARARFWGAHACGVLVAAFCRSQLSLTTNGSSPRQSYKSSRLANAFGVTSTRNARSPEFACGSVPSRQRKSPIELMPFTTREVESPDPVTRVAAADAALRKPGEDDIGEKMVLNMGPSHPATHGVLRLVLELDGEIITKATPDIGFLHRGDEKIAENMQYNQFVPYTDRLDYLAPL